MDSIGKWEDILREYGSAVQTLQKNRKMFDGVLGLGTHPGSAPCHDAMDKQVEALCREAAPEEADALAERILHAAFNWEGPEYARLMLIAVQRHLQLLLPALSPTAREALAAWYEKKYPRRLRLPVQEQLLKALKK